MYSKFALGQVVLTSGVIEKVSAATMFMCLVKHAGGDWGLVDAEWETNDLAIVNGGRIMSEYFISPRNPEKGKFWVVTEVDRSTTTMLLPDEY